MAQQARPKLRVQRGGFAGHGEELAGGGGDDAGCYASEFLVEEVWAGAVAGAEYYFCHSRAPLRQA